MSGGKHPLFGVAGYGKEGSFGDPRNYQPYKWGKAKTIEDARERDKAALDRKEKELESKPRPAGGREAWDSYGAGGLLASGAGLKKTPVSREQDDAGLWGLDGGGKAGKKSKKKDKKEKALDQERLSSFYSAASTFRIGDKVRPLNTMGDYANGRDDRRITCWVVGELDCTPQYPGRLKCQFQSKLTFHYLPTQLKLIERNPNWRDELESVHSVVQDRRHGTVEEEKKESWTGMDLWDDGPSAKKKRRKVDSAPAGAEGRQRSSWGSKLAQFCGGGASRGGGGAAEC